MDTPNESFLMGKVASVLMGRWAYDSLLRGSKVKFDIVRVPYEKTRYMASSAVYLGISAKSKRVSAALDFVRFILSEAGQASSDQ